MSQVRTLKPDSFALIPMELIRVPEVKNESRRLLTGNSFRAVNTRGAPTGLRERFFEVA
jgi:hypothetical protein